jgi:feruloyl esterase
MYHGFNDPNISALNTINYYETVTRTVGGGERVNDSMRLFMVPGMGHCRGGNGTDTFDMVTAMEEWVERGKPPSRIEASRVRNGATDRTRPLCAYPTVARYTGTGSTDQSANFECVARVR